MSTDNNKNKKKEQVKALDDLYAEARIKIREHDGMLSTPQAIKLVLEELPQRLEEALSEAEEDIGLDITQHAEKAYLE